ncbi:hypothetical protein CP533_6594 [Ophiocordyceps camponoti-saundersi (nom. inval.)]|nr:hypothetical protein CP533_6594 [Ophiocordyceps camponoti-saundersi (nom. inval.)]
MGSFTYFAISSLLALLLAIAALSPVKAVIAKLLRRRESSWSEGSIQVVVDPKDAKFEYEKKTSSLHTDFLQMTETDTDSVYSIVAVHGLGADAEYTWSRKVATGRVHLLRDLIAKDFPEARVLNFAYNSVWWADAPVKTAQIIARGLLEQLQRRRSGRRRLPILFIGHSFGGIVIKEALCIAGDDEKEIVDDTHGIVFLGTPHQGSAASTLGAMAASLMTLAGSDASLMLSLKSRKKQLSDLEERFGQCMKEKQRRREKTELVCFSETKPSWIAGIPIGVIVDRDSARCWDAEVVHVDVDHSGLNKCSGPDDSLYVMLRDKLQRLVPTATARQSSNQQYVLTKLDMVKGAVFGSYDDQHEGGCLADTRQRLLKEVDDWANDPARESIYWLQGMAGTGKSTIARSVARNSRLAASFFFKRGEGDRGKSRLFFTTLVAQLAEQLPVMADHLRNTLESDPGIAHKALSYQFDELLLKPLKHIHSGSSNVNTVVIDALDECEGDQDVDNIIYHLSQLRQPGIYPLKLFITSRFEPPIRLGFERIGGEYVELPLHKIPAPEIEHDIAAFLRFRLREQIRCRFRMGAGWPSRYQLQSLLEMAVPLFIFAATACRFIEDYKQKCGGANGRLQQILQYRDAGKLGSTYLPILDQTINDLKPHERDDAIQRFKRIVGSIITLANPLPADSLARLLGIEPAEVEDELYLLHSVLDIPSDPKVPVKLFHESFRDFLACSTNRHCFLIDRSATHKMLANRCLHLLFEDGNLKKDICGLEIAGTLQEDVEREKVDKHLPPEVQYACLYWAHHLKESDSKLHDGHQAFHFLQTHLLHWTEAMSLMGRMTESIESILALQSLVEVGKGVQVAELLYDAGRFLLNGRRGIEQAPLQVYVSALAFAPEKSLVRQRFKSHIDWITTKPVVERNWDSCLQTLNPPDRVQTIAFCHDGQLVSASRQCIEIWDPGNGALLKTVDIGHMPSKIDLSHDGRRLALFPEGRGIEIWETANGALQWRLPSNGGKTTKVAFSTHKGGRLASSVKLDGENLIQLWDLGKKTLLRTFQSVGEITSLTFSIYNDGQLLASRSRDGEVKIWDTEKGALLRTLYECGRMMAHFPYASVFSTHHDGRLLAFPGLPDDNIELWDAVSGILQRKFLVPKREGDSNFGHPVSLALSRSDYDTIDIWDAASEALLLRLPTDDDHQVRRVKFSSDSRLLVSVSSLMKLRVWNLATGVLQQTMDEIPGSEYIPFELVFSSSSRLLAGLYDGNLFVWETTTGAVQWSTMGAKRDYSHLTSLAFSRDEHLLASASGDGRIMFWDALTGALQWTLKSMHHSFKGKRLLESHPHSDSTLAWDVSTGLLQPKVGQSRISLHAIAFSSDDRLLASVVSVKGVKQKVQFVTLRDARTGSLHQSPKGISGLAEARHISSYKDSLHVFTDYDCVRIPIHGELRGQVNGQVRNVSVSREKGLSGYGLSPDARWISWNGKNVLWIPPEYKPSIAKISRSTETMALRCGFGRVLTIVSSSAGPY